MRLFRKSFFSEVLLSNVENLSKTLQIFIGSVVLKFCIIKYELFANAVVFGANLHLGSQTERSTFSLIQ